MWASSVSGRMNESLIAVWYGPRRDVRQWLGEWGFRGPVGVVGRRPLLIGVLCMDTSIRRRYWM